MPAHLAHALNHDVDRRLRDSGDDDVVRAQRSQRPTAQSNNAPADLGKQLIFATIGAFASPHVLITIAPHRVELDRDRQLGNDDVGPNLKTTEERRLDANGRCTEIHRKPFSNERPQASFGGRRRSRGTVAAECLAGAHIVG